MNSGHYFCDKCDDVVFSEICCGLPARWVPDTVKPAPVKPAPRAIPVADETAHQIFAEMRAIVAATPDFTKNL